jgi:carbonic anhydrase/acetyltransferase-like protein (isoleucine patch superfamily)
VELGALVVTQGRNASQVGPEAGFWSSTWPVLGRTVLDRWVERVQGLGVDLLAVVDREACTTSRIHTMVDWAKGGVERILVILLGSYAEVDFTDLIRFHHQGQNQITRVFDSLGPLGISLLDRQMILKINPERKTWSDRNHSSRYDFLGYALRLSSLRAYRTLVEDALEGRSGIQPVALEAGHNTWIHPSAEIDPSVRLEGPCYVGPYARLSAGVVITGGSSVEHSCDIDIGTTLERSSLLPNTHLAAGLHVRDSVIDGTRLEHLGRNVSVDLGPLGLAARKKPVTKQSLQPLPQRRELGNTVQGRIQPQATEPAAGQTSIPTEAPRS